MSDRDAKRAQYREAFETEAARVYPQVEEAIDRLGGFRNDALIVRMAGELACPVKASPPNWQHGRLLYALARSYLAARPDIRSLTFLDIGTAKGFSAMCLLHALVDAKREGEIYTLDVIDPAARVARNSVAELDGLMTLQEFLSAWIPLGHSPAPALYAHQCAGMFFDRVVNAKRIHLAFVDGKHKTTDVLAEASGIAARQLKGDLIMFDDVQIPAVAQAVKTFLKGGDYAGEAVQAKAERSYSICRRIQ